MPNPFPGMNPYLESPDRWRAVHHALSTSLMLELNTVLPPKFFSTVEEREYPPLSNTDEATEPYVEVRIAGSEDKVIAVIEVPSPKNKSREAKGRAVYVSNRDQPLHSGTHLIEIDLLREGAYMLAAPQDEVAIYQKTPWDYGVCLHRAEAGRTFLLWLTSVRQRLPRFYVPLTPGYPDVVIDLQACIERVYDGGLFDRRIDYRKEPVPSLAPTDATWVDTLLQEKGIR